MLLSAAHVAGLAAAVAGCLAGAGAAGLRWLRVAQREHYLPGSATRFAWRWWRASSLDAVVVAAAVGGLVASVWWPPAALVPAAAVALGPPGLRLRGRTARLAWTRRLRTLAAVWAVLVLAVMAGGVAGGIGAPMAAGVALAVPLLVDAACGLTAPLERRLGDVFVQRAAHRLRRVAPTVVAITGSYGKTSTKGYVAHLAGASRSLVASPASFNNRAGLARAVNEHLTDGTEVFVAEMGTYGPGEIADLCRWVRPTVSVITAIGPVHLERFGSEDRIVEAKSEIFGTASVAVLAVDDARLAAVADRLETEGKRVVRCSARDSAADVSAIPDGQGLTVRLSGAVVAEKVAGHAQPGNVACAVAVAVQLGVDPAEIARRLASLPSVAHRLEPLTGPGGATVLDDTYNANPAGTRAALARLAGLRSASNTLVVVTPGMVELGPLQVEANAAFAEEAARVADHLLIVGRTNRRALLAGAAAAAAGGGPSAEVHVMADRQQAVAWVRRTLGAGDAVLYENDLPDHYP